MLQIAFTGDPFVDVGALVMNTLPQKTVEDKIRFATDVYVEQWKGKINAVFLHSKITHISVSGKPRVQRQRSLEYYLGVLQNRGAVSNGHCRICAQKGPLFEAGRDNCPLAGSGEFVNFHHSHQSALALCKECLVKLYFVPLGVLQCRENLMLLQIQNAYTAKLWQEEVLRNNIDKIHKGSSEGVLRFLYVNPRNALFHFVSRLISKFELIDLPSQQFRLFCFNNFGSKPNVEIHDLPNTVFSFLKRVLKPDLRTDWVYFVRKHYRFGKTFHFDENAHEWFEIQKKETVKVADRDYVGSHHNRVQDYLLSGKSILRLLCSMHKAGRFPIQIAMSYLKEVRGMRHEQIELIRTIAGKIIALAESDEDYKKYITPIEGARFAYQLRSAILRMVKAQYKAGQAEPFVRLTDYVEYLFPDGQSWYEVRDLMLICLYEKLHDLQIQPEEISDEVIPDIEEVGEMSLEEINK